MGSSLPVATQPPSRIVLQNVRPQLDGGRHPIKRVVGDRFRVTVEVLRDGHDLLTVELHYRPITAEAWRIMPMTCINPGLDLWGAEVELDQVGHWQYYVEAWANRFGSWRRDLLKRVEAGQDVFSELFEGIGLVEEAKKRATKPEAQARFVKTLHQLLKLTQAGWPQGDATAKQTAIAAFLDEGLLELMAAHPDRSGAATQEVALEVTVDRVAARFAAWYELFPRSHGGFRGCIDRLPELAALGFDVLYLPPIHPIGRTHRKGKNNSLVAQSGEPGSPWAIGNELGGHKSIEPSLGTMADFEALVAAARRYGMEIALDYAIQCSPDHPWVRAHPEWFSHRPDGTIKYAENPPKKYQDIYPINFDTPAWQSLWEELKSVVLFWIDHGVKTFRVDNPHTKPIPFWEWLIGEVRRKHPDAIFLSEAFTRPRMKEILAKVGFTQSYTYFTWRNGKKELIEYLTELTQTEVAEYLRANFFANTPDILHEYLQKGGRPAFKIRYLLAATLSSVCGIYSGFELGENVPVKEGSEEYIDSEKYEIKERDWDAPGNLKKYVGLINHCRRDHPALQLYDNLHFHATSDDHVLCYSKATPDGKDVVLVAVNLDPHHVRESLVDLDLEKLSLRAGAAYVVEDQFTGNAWTWQGSRGYVRLDPQQEPAHLFVVKPVG